MSEIGSQSGLYEELHDCAELVDGVLAGLKESASNDVSKDSQELGRLLTSLGDRNWVQTPSRIVAILLGQFGATDRQEWARVGATLIENKVSETTIVRLEELASRLEQEQQSVMARIQGL